MLSASFLREGMKKKEEEEEQVRKRLPQSCGSMYFNTPTILVCSWTVKLLKGNLLRYIYIFTSPFMPLPIYLKCAHLFGHIRWIFSET